VKFPCWHSGTKIAGDDLVSQEELGAYAAFNMLGKMIPFNRVPFSWRDNYGSLVQQAGVAPSWDNVHIDGNPRSHDYMAYYIKSN